MSKPILFITGGNTGLGLEVVRALCKSSVAYEIIIGSRSTSKGEAAIATVKQEIPSTTSTLSTVQTDVESDASIQAAHDTIASRHGRLDVLINNAGANFDADHAAGRLTQREAFNKTWDVNVAGTQVLTTTFVPLLLRASAGPRLLFVTSGTSSMTETQNFDTVPMQRINASPDAGWPKPAEVNPIVAYRSAKTGLNMLATQWARVLKNDGVKVFTISPGFLATGLAGIGPEKLKQMGARDPSEGGNFIRDVVEGKRDDDTAVVIRAAGVQPW